MSTQKGNEGKYTKLIHPYIFSQYSKDAAMGLCVFTFLLILPAILWNTVSIKCNHNLISNVNQYWQFSDSDLKSHAAYKTV